MGILWMGTADLQDKSIFSNASGFLTISTNTARTGTRSFHMSSGYGGYVYFTSSSEIYLKFAINMIDTSYSDIRFMNTIDNKNHVRLYIYPTYISYRRSTTQIGTVNTLYNIQNNWALFEVRVTINDSTGIIQIKMNGQTILDFTGDTMDGGTIQEIDGMYFAGDSAYFDDLVIRNDDWPGLGGLYVLSPNAGSTNENWTASTGNPEECVDELPPSFTDYIYTDGNTPDTEHLFGIESLPVTPTSIAGVGVLAQCKSDQVSDANLRTLLKSGTTTEVGTSRLLQTSAAWIDSYYAINPDDSAAWENADIDALEIGVETQ